MPSSAPPSPGLSILAALSLWTAGFWLGAALLITASTTEAAWAITLAALLALGSGWLSAEAKQSNQTATTWLGFTLVWTLWLAKLMATAAVALSLASYLLSQAQSVDAVWLLPATLVTIWGAVLSQKPRSWHPQVIWSLALISGLGLAGLLLSEITTVIATVIGPVIATVPAGANLQPYQSPASDAPLRLAQLLQTTALLSVALAGAGNLALIQDLPQPAQIRRKLLSLTITLGWLLYFGLIILRQLQTSGQGMTPDHLPAALGNPLHLLHFAPALSFGLGLSAVAAFAATLWLQILPLEQPLRRLQLSAEFWPLPPRVSLGVMLSCLALVGEIETIWAFSAFAALIHRALWHWQASQWQGWSGLNRRQYLHGLAGATSLILAFWLEWQVWLVSLGLIALGLVWRGMRQWSDTEE